MSRCGRPGPARRRSPSTQCASGAVTQSHACTAWDITAAWSSSKSKTHRPKRSALRSWWTAQTRRRCSHCRDARLRSNPTARWRFLCPIARCCASLLATAGSMFARCRGGNPFGTGGSECSSAACGPSCPRGGSNGSMRHARTRCSRRRRRLRSSTSRRGGSTTRLSACGRASRCGSGAPPRRRVAGTGARSTLGELHALLVRVRGDTGVDLLPGFPAEWLGAHLALHDVPLRRGRLSFALRWHGDRPALLWDAPAGYVLRLPALDQAWESATPVGETLLAAPANPAATPVATPESFS